MISKSTAKSPVNSPMIDYVVIDILLYTANIYDQITMEL